MRGGGIIIYFLKVKVYLPINQNQNNTLTSQILSKWHQNGVEGKKVLDGNSCKTAYKTISYSDYLRRDKVFELSLTIYKQYLAPCEFLLFS